MHFLQRLHGPFNLVLVEGLPVPLLHGPGVADAGRVGQQEDILGLVLLVDFGPRLEQSLYEETQKLGYSDEFHRRGFAGAVQSVQLNNISWVQSVSKKLYNFYLK